MTKPTHWGHFHGGAKLCPQAGQRSAERGICRPQAGHSRLPNLEMS